LALVVHQPGESSGREREGLRGLGSEDGGRRVDVRDVTQYRGVELQVGVQLPGSAQADLVGRGAVDVVEHRRRTTTSCDRAEVAYIDSVGESPAGPAELRSIHRDERRDVGPPGDVPRGRARCPHMATLVYRVGPDPM